DEKALPVGFAPPAKVQGIDGKVAAHELLCSPGILAAVRIHPMADHDHRASLRLRPPGADEDAQASRTVQVLLLSVPIEVLGHRRASLLAAVLSFDEGQ